MLCLSNRPVSPACDIETIISRFAGLFLEIGGSGRGDKNANESEMHAASPHGCIQEWHGLNPCYSLIESLHSNLAQANETERQI